MSSGFVSGGTSDQPRERNELWEKAEQELEAARQRKLEQKTHDGKSLYEVLQENKAAKQEAFEEAAKLKHQFRSLDEDDVAFLNSIRDSEASRKREVEKETSVRLETFRKLQQQNGSLDSDDVVADAEDSDSKRKDDEPTWQVTSKKRKRELGLGLKGVKAPKTRDASAAGTEISVTKQASLLGKSSEDSDDASNAKSNPGPTVNMRDGQKVENNTSTKEKAESTTILPPIATTSGSLLGLGGYDSDDDDD